MRSMIMVDNAQEHPYLDWNGVPLLRVASIKRAASLVYAPAGLWSKPSCPSCVPGKNDAPHSK